MANFCGKCGTPLNGAQVCPMCNPVKQEVAEQPVVSIKGNFCSKCGSVLDESQICTVCEGNVVPEQTEAEVSANTRKSKNKLLVVLLSLVLVAAIILTTVFVVIPAFSKNNKFYSSGNEAIAFKTDSYGTFYMTGSGLCSIDENGEVFILHYYDFEAEKELPIFSTNMVCVEDTLYMQQSGNIYKIDITGVDSCDSELWLSTDEIEDMDLDMYEYDYLSVGSFYVAGENWQYEDGYIYYSRDVMNFKQEFGAPIEDLGRLNVIGRIDLETRTPEILKIMTDYAYEFDYVVYDDKVYYTADADGSVNTAIYSMTIDEEDDELIYEGSTPMELGIYEDELYFIDGMQEISCVSLDGSNYQVLAQTDENDRIKTYTIDSSTGTVYLGTYEGIYEVSAEKHTLRKIMADCMYDNHLACVDSKLYGMMLNYIDRSAYIYEDSEPTKIVDTDSPMSLYFGSEDEPILSGAFYDTESKTASVVYTYNELSESEMSSVSSKERYSHQKYFVEDYDGESYMIRSNGKKIKIVICE